jgi:putative hydrolase of the HAD superfamily
MMLRLALFDLDDTLYPSSCGLWPVLVMRMETYMIDRLGIAPQNVPEMRRRYLANFGSTMNGLRHEYDLDTVEYLAYVHDIPLEQFLRPEPELSAMLGRLPVEKAVFTNADAPHARRVLAALGIEQHFSRIVDVHSMDFNHKPDPRAYQHVLSVTGARPDECLFVDDRLANLQPAAEMGMLTVLVSDGGHHNAALPPGIDFQISTVLELEPIISGAIAKTATEKAGA